MSMVPRDDRKREKGLKKFINSFSYPIKGLKYAYRNEQNLFVDIFIALAVITLGIIFKISIAEWAILKITIGIVIAAELINTAIEATVDLVTQDYHPLAKVAKDTSAAAVFILAIVAVIEGIIIFLPKIINLF